MVQTNGAAKIVMVVDDSVENLTLLETALSRAGYDVRLAPNGKLALRALLRRVCFKHQTPREVTNRWLRSACLADGSALSRHPSRISLGAPTTVVRAPRSRRVFREHTSVVTSIDAMPRYCPSLKSPTVSPMKIIDYLAHARGFIC